MADKRLLGTKKSLHAERKKRIFKIKLILSIIFLIAIFSAFVWLMRKPVFRITDISVSGLKTLNSESIIHKTRTLIGGDSFYLFPKNNFLFYPKRKIMREITDSDKRIKEVSVEIGNDKTLEISIEEYLPEYYWCREGDCFESDKYGYIFRHIGNTENENKFIILEGGIWQDPLGTHFAENNISNLDEVIAFFKSRNFLISTIKTEDNVDFSFVLENGVSVVLDFDDGIYKTLERLDIFFTENLEYINRALYKNIDVRFGNKIFYTESDDSE